MTEVLLFFCYSLIVFLLALVCGGTLIGYYFAKKKEYEFSKLTALGAAIKQNKNGQN